MAIEWPFSCFSSKYSFLTFLEVMQITLGLSCVIGIKLTCSPSYKSHLFTGGFLGDQHQFSFLICQFGATLMASFHFFTTSLALRSNYLSSHRRNCEMLSTKSGLTASKKFTDLENGQSQSSLRENGQSNGRVRANGEVKKESHHYFNTRSLFNCKVYLMEMKLRLLLSFILLFGTSIALATLDAKGYTTISSANYSLNETSFFADFDFDLLISLLGVINSFTYLLNYWLIKRL